MKFEKKRTSQVNDQTIKCMKCMNAGNGKFYDHVCYDDLHADYGVEVANYYIVSWHAFLKEEQYETK